MQQFDQWLLSLTFGLRIAELAKDEGTVTPTPWGTGARAPYFYKWLDTWGHRE